MIENSGTGVLHYTYGDHLGSLTEVVNSSTGAVTHQSFDAWGNTRSAADWRNASTLPLFAGRGFTGHEHLEAFALINMNGRMYDPVLGRFLSPDPYVQMPDFSQSFNRYGYCLNNPLIYTDPTGEFFWVPVIIGAAIGTYTGYKIADAKGYDMGDLQTYGFMLGGAVIGGLSGYAGATIAAGGGFMANTAGIAYSSMFNSMGMSTLSEGMIQPSVSFGVASYDFGTGEWGHIGKKGNSALANIGYGFGALANIQDVIAGTNGVTITDKSRPKLTGHNEIGGKFNENDILISVSPSINLNPQITGSLKWEWLYVKRSLQGDPVAGLNKALIRPKNAQVVTTVRNVNGKWLSKMTNNLNSGRNLLNTGAFNYGLFNGCVNYTSRAFLYSGVINVNAFLPVTAPLLLNAELFIRQMGIYASSYTINY